MADPDPVRAYPRWVYAPGYPGDNPGFIAGDSDSDPVINPSIISGMTFYDTPDDFPKS